MRDIRNQTQYREQMDLQRQQSNAKNAMENSRLDVEKQKINAQKEIAQTKLQIARENKNKYDNPKSEDKK